MQPISQDAGKFCCFLSHTHRMASLSASLLPIDGQWIPVVPFNESYLPILCKYHLHKHALQTFEHPQPVSVLLSVPPMVAIVSSKRTWIPKWKTSPRSSIIIYILYAVVWVYILLCNALWRQLRQQYCSQSIEYGLMGILVHAFWLYSNRIYGQNHIVCIILKNRHGKMI